MKNTAEITHGGNIVGTAKKLGCRPADLIDLSSNLNPLGMPAVLRQILRDSIDEAGYLPEPGSETLRRLFAGHHHRSPEEVLVGSGTTEFIFSIPAALRLKEALIIEPTYSDYRLASNWAGLPVRSLSLRPEDNYRFDFDRVARALRGGEIVFICNPNNPTGVLAPNHELHGFIGAHPSSSFLVDESYLPFTREISLLDRPILPNLLVLSSYSKIYSIPGLRLGFLTASADHLARLAGLRKPWGVNRLAQIAGEFLVAGGEEHRHKTLSHLEVQLPAVIEMLAGLPGVRTIPGSGNFILSRLQSRIPVSELHQRLLQEYRIMVRDCGDFEGLPENYFRISIKADPDMRLFAEAARRILE